MLGGLAQAIQSSLKLILKPSNEGMLRVGVDLPGLIRVASGVPQFVVGVIKGFTLELSLLCVVFEGRGILDKPVNVHFLIGVEPQGDLSSLLVAKQLAEGSLQFLTLSVGVPYHDEF